MFQEIVPFCLPKNTLNMVLKLFELSSLKGSLCENVFLTIMQVIVSPKQ